MTSVAQRKRSKKQRARTRLVLDSEHIYTLVQGDETLEAIFLRKLTLEDFSFGCIQNGQGRYLTLPGSKVARRDGDNIILKGGNGLDGFIGEPLPVSRGDGIVYHVRNSDYALTRKAGRT